MAEVDLFECSRSAGDVTLITVAETGGFSGSLLATRTTFVGPDGTQVTAFDSPGDTQVTLPETGTYVILVNGNPLTTTGTYNISLTCL